LLQNGTLHFMSLGSA